MRESQEEGFCIAVPVRSHEGEIIAALSFSGILGGLSEEETARYFQLLKEASAELPRICSALKGIAAIVQAGKRTGSALARL